MKVHRTDVDLLHRVASRLIIGYDEQDLGLEVDRLAARMSPEVGVCVPCKGSGLVVRDSGQGFVRCEACEGSGEVTPADGAEPDRAAEFERARREALQAEQTDQGEVTPNE